VVYNIPYHILLTIGFGLNPLQAAIEQGLKEAFPLIHFERYESEVLKVRRCRACIAVTLKVQSQPRISTASRARIMKLPPLDANGDNSMEGGMK
jgi:hypothetical protein